MSHYSSSVNGKGTSHKDPLSRILDELSSLKSWKEKQGETDGPRYQGIQNHDAYQMESHCIVVVKKHIENKVLFCINF